MSFGSFFLAFCICSDAIFDDIDKGNRNIALIFFVRSNPWVNTHTRFDKTRLLKPIVEALLLSIEGSRLLNHFLDGFSCANFVKTNQTILNSKDLLNCGIRQ